MCVKVRSGVDVFGSLAIPADLVYIVCKCIEPGCSYILVPKLSVVAYAEARSSTFSVM